MSKKKKQGISLRLCVSLLAMVLLLGCAVGGTIAWLTAQSDTVKNTFTVGNIEIDLYESQYDQTTNELVSGTQVKTNTYKIVPGKNVPKDPEVLVKKGSEPCWVFIKVEESNFVSGLISYQIWSPLYWEKLEGEEGVYYADVSPENDEYSGDFDNGVLKINEKIDIINGREITVSGDITKEDLAATKDKEVSLNFTAYAIQREGFDTAAAAWAQIKTSYPEQFPTASAE